MREVVGKWYILRYDIPPQALYYDHFTERPITIENETDQIMTIFFPDKTKILPCFPKEKDGT